MSEHDHMEEYFRDRAENFDYPFNEKDWQSLEARLDHELPTSGGNFWGQVLIGILIISLPWWPWSVPSLESNSPIEQTVTDSKSDQGEAVESIPTSPGPSTSNVAEVEEDSPIEEIEPNNVSVGTNENDGFRTILSSSEAVIPASVKTYSPATKQEDRLAHNDRKVGDPEPTETTIFRDQTLTDVRFPLEQSEESSEEASEVSYAADSKETEETESDSSEDLILDNTDRNFKVWRPFLVAGFEYGGTQMNKSPQLGYRAGFGVRYQPLEKWSFSASALYANIRYTAYGDEYKTDAWSLPSTYSLSWTDGTCEMIEIPIEVRYHALPWLNAGLGVRSYYVLGEQYDLYMESNYYPSRKYPYSHNEGSSAFLAHLDLSVGFTIPINKYQLEIQPFYQLPLAGIGQGSVEWKSAGVTTLFLF